MNPDNERDELWELLGRAEKPCVSPFFARNVLREIRLQQVEKRTPWSWFARQWRVAALGSIAAILLAIPFVLPRVGKPAPAVPAVELARQAPDSADYEVIARLDELLAYENNAIWLDTPSE